MKMKLYEEMSYSVDRYNLKLNILQDKANVDNIILLYVPIYIILLYVYMLQKPF